MNRPEIESPAASFAWSTLSIVGLLAGVGVSLVPGLSGIWDIGGGAFERRVSQDARNDGYYEELLDATEARGAGGWLKGPSEIAPLDWVRLHETDGVVWDDPFQRFRLRPGADFDYKGAPLGVNALGLRDRETLLEKGDGVRRVAMVGASVLMGSGVAVEETFENRFEDAVSLGVLGDRGPVEFLNFGVAGYRLDQLADVVVERIEVFDPDAVLLVINDLALNPNWSRHVAWLVSEGRDLRYDYLREVVASAGIDADDAPRVMVSRLAPYRDQVVRGGLLVAREWCEARGIPLVLLVLAQPSATSTFSGRVEGISPLMQELGLRSLDITGAYGEHPDLEALWLRPWDRHPTSEGHALMAEGLVEKLQSDPEMADLILGPVRELPNGVDDG